ncbi:MAG: DUF4097 domain-containing protein [Clostridiales bacterium]|jgi:hypothetical protein|nr:DUF4097 domain-containing protein [Clostridiales bacterium]
MENNNSNNRQPMAGYPEPAVPKFERPPTRKRRNLWTPGGVLLFIGIILMAAGWLNGARGGVNLSLSKRLGLNFNVPGIGEGSGTEMITDSSEPFSEIEINSDFVNVYFEEGGNYGFEIIMPEGYEPVWSNEGGRLYIDTSGGDEGGFHATVGMSFEDDAAVYVYYPEGARFDYVTVISGSGRIRGELPYVGNSHFETGSGGTELTFNSGAEIFAESGSGDIDLINNGDENLHARLESVSGDITVKNNAWNGLEAETGSGSIDIEAVLLGETNLKTGSGNVEVYSALDGSFGYELSSASGDIDVNEEGFAKRASHNADADNVVKVDTGSGSIDLELR